MASNTELQHVDDDWNRTGVVYIISKFKVKNKNQPFRCLMIYQDKQSGFCIIIPLLYKIELEIVLELFKIFTMFNPPARVFVNSCSQEMVVNIATNMKALCDTWDVEFIKKNVDTNDIVMEVITKLHEWMEFHKKDQWELGCATIQRDINSKKNAEGISPQVAFFSRNPFTLNIQNDTSSENEFSNHTTVKVKVERLESDDVMLSNDLQDMIENNVSIKQEME